MTKNIPTFDNTICQGIVRSSAEQKPFASEDERPRIFNNAHILVLVMYDSNRNKTKGNRTKRSKKQNQTKRNQKLKRKETNKTELIKTCKTLQIPGKRPRNV